MKCINIMNFVRYIDERRDFDSIEFQYTGTEMELDLCNEFGFENTFLLQYDAMISERYQKLFREKATERTELGLWYEIVKPLCDAVGLPYRSELGYQWDWHICPGFSMAYTPEERELLIDEAMRKFKEVFGYYPKTVASWLMDSHTISYLADHYDISAFANCRDQVNTDAYTLIGGYFNQAYYPARKNMFSPAQTDAERVNVPMFRLLGPCPVHNYENKKYLQNCERNKWGPCTLEPIWHTGRDPDAVKWFFRTYFENEDLGFSYAQLGQENSFSWRNFMPGLRMQFEQLAKLENVRIEKMSATGEAFKAKYGNKTPATSVVALDNWDIEDAQSVYYDCENYMANIFRHEGRVSIRAFFLFDERVEERYLRDVCTTFDAVYDNLPLMNTQNWTDKTDRTCGIILDEDGECLTAVKTGEGELTVRWKNSSAVFDEEKISVTCKKIHFRPGKPNADIRREGNMLLYEYRGAKYALSVENADVTDGAPGEYIICPTNGSCILRPIRK